MEKSYCFIKSNNYKKQKNERKEINKKKCSKNKQYSTKTNKRIFKSNLPHRKMILNKEWYIIPRELEAE